jgi:YegS/Rv2252/BmrU family lipid kinase
MGRRAVLIFNPAAGRAASKRKNLPRLVERLAELGIEARPAPTEGPGHASELAGQAVAESMDLALAWGGDGTVNEVARGLLRSPVALGVLPGGTVNVFARETGIPLDPLAACEVLASGRTRALPVGSASGRPFLLMAGIGLDAAVVDRLNSTRLKRRLGVSAFWLEGIHQLAVYPFPIFRVRAGGREYPASTLIAGKLRTYGNGYLITPDAGVDAPWLDVVLFQGRRRIDYLRYLVGVLSASHTGFADVVHFKTERLELEAPSSVRCQLDGEPLGPAPAWLEVLPGALLAVLPVPAEGRKNS